MLPQFKGMHIRLLCDLKFALAVNVSGNGCGFFCVSLVIDWQTLQGARCLSHHGSWYKLQHNSGLDKG